MAAVCAVAGMLVFAVAASANAPSPVPGTTKVDSEVVNSDGSITITVEGQWYWPTPATGLSGQLTNTDCPGTRDGVGYQVAWFDGTGSAIGGSKSPNGTLLVGTTTDNIVHAVEPDLVNTSNLELNGVPSSYAGGTPSKTDANNWVSNCGQRGDPVYPSDTNGSYGTWGPISHTYPANFSGPIKFCPITYDPHGTPQDKGGFGEGTGDITAGGSGHNGDNSYEGNGEFNACNTITVPTFTTTASNGTVGQPISDTASLTGSQSGQGGTITWNVYSASDTTCSTPLNAQPSALTATVNGDGSYTSPSYTPASPGTYQWVATFSGTNPTINIKSACNTSSEMSVVNKSTPKIVTIASDGTVGKPVTDIAQLTGGDSPGGTITWNVYDNASCSGSPLFTGSAAVTGTSTQSPAWTPSNNGTFYWVATYGGDANNSSVASGCADEPFNIQQAPSPAMKVTKLESFSSSSGFVPGPITGQVGQTVYYVMDVFNTGNTPLAIQFSDPGCDQNTLSGPTTIAGSVGADGLSSGGELQWTCSHVLTAGDVSGYTNTATAQGTPPPGQGSVQNGQASVVAYSNTPGMTVTKLQRDGSTGSFTTSEITGSVGDTINYEIQVSNTGNVPLTLSISDPHCDGTPAGPFLVSGTLNGNVLQAGGVAQYTCSHVLAAGDIPQYTNVGTITGQPPSGPPLTGTGIVVVDVTQAAIKVLKLQSLSATGPFTTSTLTAKVGQTIYYEIQATNTGNTPLTLAISDPMCDANTLQGPVALSGTLTSGALSAGGEAQYTCTHVLKLGDANPFTNTATVTGTPPSGPPVSGTSSVTAKKQAVQAKKIKRCPAGTVKKIKRGKKGKKVIVCKAITHKPKRVSGFTG